MQKTAILKMSLLADSSYSSEVETRIGPTQWKLINFVVSASAEQLDQLDNKVMALQAKAKS
jgi:hypothetical protein